MMLQRAQLEIAGSQVHGYKQHLSSIGLHLSTA
jgi:hypothetical protein